VIELEWTNNTGTGITISQIDFQAFMDPDLNINFTGSGSVSDFKDDFSFSEESENIFTSSGQTISFRPQINNQDENIYLANNSGVTLSFSANIPREANMFQLKLKEVIATTQMEDKSIIAVNTINLPLISPEFKTNVTPKFLSENSYINIDGLTVTLDFDRPLKNNFTDDTKNLFYIINDGNCSSGTGLRFNIETITLDETSQKLNLSIDSNNPILVNDENLKVCYTRNEEADYEIKATNDESLNSFVNSGINITNNSTLAAADISFKYGNSYENALNLTNYMTNFPKNSDTKIFIEFSRNIREVLDDAALSTTKLLEYINFSLYNQNQESEISNLLTSAENFGFIQNDENKTIISVTLPELNYLTGYTLEIKNSELLEDTNNIKLSRSSSEKNINFETTSEDPNCRVFNLFPTNSQHISTKTIINGYYSINNATLSEYYFRIAVGGKTFSTEFESNAINIEGYNFSTDVPLSNYSLSEQTPVFYLENKNTPQKIFICNSNNFSFTPTIEPKTIDDFTINGNQDIIFSDDIILPLENESITFSDTDSNIIFRYSTPDGILQMSIAPGTTLNKKINETNPWGGEFRRPRLLDIANLPEGVNISNIPNFEIKTLISAGSDEIGLSATNDNSTTPIIFQVPVTENNTYTIYYSNNGIDWDAEETTVTTNDLMCVFSINHLTYFALGLDTSPSTPSSTTITGEERRNSGGGGGMGYTRYNSKWGEYDIRKRSRFFEQARTNANTTYSNPHTKNYIPLSELGEDKFFGKEYFQFLNKLGGR